MYKLSTRSDSERLNRAGQKRGNGTPWTGRPERNGTERNGTEQNGTERKDYLGWRVSQWEDRRRAVTGDAVLDRMCQQREPSAGQVAYRRQKCLPPPVSLPLSSSQYGTALGHLINTDSSDLITYHFIDFDKPRFSLLISFQPSGRTVREHSVRRTSVLNKRWTDRTEGRPDLRLRYGCSRPQACAMLSVRNLARDVPCRVSSRVFKSIAALRRAHARCAFLGAWMHAHGTFRMHVCMRERPLLTHVPCPSVRARVLS